MFAFTLGFDFCGWHMLLILAICCIALCIILVWFGGFPLLCDFTWLPLCFCGFVAVSAVGGLNLHWIFFDCISLSSLLSGVVCLSSVYCCFYVCGFDCRLG